MGAGGSVTLDEVKDMPQYTILGGEAKYNELKEEDGTVKKDKFADPYLQFGGAYAGDGKDSADFKYVTWDAVPGFTDAHKSLMAKTLTPELFEKLKDVKSDKGYTLSNAIMTGVVTPHLGVGCTAGDEDCWTAFKDLYYPVIKGWHGYDAETQTHPVDLDFSKLVFSDEKRETFNKYVKSTRIRAARNISGFSLPTGATTEDRAGVEKVLQETFAGLEGELAGTYYELGKLTDEQTAFLLEKGFLFQIPSAKNLLTGAGAARSWPEQPWYLPQRVPDGSCLGERGRSLQNHLHGGRGRYPQCLHPLLRSVQRHQGLRREERHQAHVEREARLHGNLPFQPWYRSSCLRDGGTH